MGKTVLHLEHEHSLAVAQWISKNLQAKSVSTSIGVDGYWVHDRGPSHDIIQIIYAASDVECYGPQPPQNE